MNWEPAVAGTDCFCDINVSGTVSNCDNGNNNGQVVIGSTGGTANYLYSFDGGAYSNNNIFTNLTEGIYLVTSTDDSGCTIATEVMIMEPNAMTGEVVQQNNLLGQHRWMICCHRLLPNI